MHSDKIDWKRKYVMYNDGLNGLFNHYWTLLRLQGIPDTSAINLPLHVQFTQKNSGKDVHLNGLCCGMSTYVGFKRGNMICISQTHDDLTFVTSIDRLRLILIVSILYYIVPATYFGRWVGSDRQGGYYWLCRDSKDQNHIDEMKASMMKTLVDFDLLPTFDFVSGTYVSDSIVIGKSGKKLTMEIELNEMDGADIIGFAEKDKIEITGMVIKNVVTLILKEFVWNVCVVVFLNRDNQEELTGYWFEMLDPLTPVDKPMQSDKFPIKSDFKMMRVKK